jgi:putative restriction endonuclease
VQRVEEDCPMAASGRATK